MTIAATDRLESRQYWTTLGRRYKPLTWKIAHQQTHVVSDREDATEEERDARFMKWLKLALPPSTFQVSLVLLLAIVSCQGCGQSWRTDDAHWKNTDDGHWIKKVDADSWVHHDKCPQCQKARSDEAFTRFDENEDGNLTENELPASIWAHLSSADANNDGTVSPDEVTQSALKMTWARDK